MQNPQTDNRILARRGARELAPKEIGSVSGGFTTTLMTVDDCGNNFDVKLDR